MTGLGVPVPTLVTRQNVVFGGRFLGTSCRRQPVTSASFLEKYPAVVAGNKSGSEYGTIESNARSKASTIFRQRTWGPSGNRFRALGCGMLVWGVAVQSVPETWGGRQNSRGSSACCHSRLAASKTARGRRRGSEDQHTCMA